MEITSNGPNEAGRRPGFSREPVAGEAWHDAPADQHDQHHGGGDPDADAVIGGTHEMSLDVEDDVAASQDAECDQHLEVAPVLPFDDLPAHDGPNQQQERVVDDSRGLPADPGRGGDRKTTDSPGQDKYEQRPALERHAPRPVRHGGHLSP